MELYNFYKKAISELAPGANWCIHNKSLEQLEWRSDEIEQPSIEDITTKAQELHDAFVENPPEPEPSPAISFS